MISRLSRRNFPWRVTSIRVSALNLRQGSSHVQLHYTTMTAPLVEYEYIHGMEYLSDYRKDGYYPVHINDRLDKRYRVVHKLGHGTFSTAWLAIDEKTTKYVAIKLSTADADCTEVYVISRLTQNHLSRSIWEDKLSLLPTALDRFELHGPNGTHTCLVALPARCSLRGAREASGSSLFQLDVARSLAGQLVMAVSLFHARGYAHGGEHRITSQDDNSADPMLKIFILATSFYSFPRPLMPYL